MITNISLIGIIKSISLIGMIKTITYIGMIKNISSTEILKTITLIEIKTISSIGITKKDLLNWKEKKISSIEMKKRCLQLEY